MLNLKLLSAWFMFINGISIYAIGMFQNGFLNAQENHYVLFGLIVLVFSLTLFNSNRIANTNDDVNRIDHDVVDNFNDIQDIYDNLEGGNE